jgi:putative oxidoreductase
MPTVRVETVGSMPVPVPHADPAPDGAGTDAVRLVGRILLGAIFLISGYGKLTGLDGFATTLANQGLPAAPVLAVIGAAVEFTAGFLIVVGFQSRLAALLGVAFVIVATLIAHRFWELGGAPRQAQWIHFLKNLTIMGGLLTLAAGGGGRFSLDGLRQRRIG